MNWKSLPLFIPPVSMKSKSQGRAFQKAMEGNGVFPQKTEPEVSWANSRTETLPSKATWGLLTEIRDKYGLHRPGKLYRREWGTEGCIFRRTSITRKRSLTFFLCFECPIFYQLLPKTNVGTKLMVGTRYYS